MKYIQSKVFVGSILVITPDLKYRYLHNKGQPYEKIEYFTIVELLKNLNIPIEVRLEVLEGIGSNYNKFIRLVI